MYVGIGCMEADGITDAAIGKCLRRLGIRAMLAGSDGFGVGCFGLSKMRCDGSGDGRVRG